MMTVHEVEAPEVLSGGDSGTFFNKHVVKAASPVMLIGGENGTFCEKHAVEAATFDACGAMKREAGKDH